jgi:abhydrolase domain-containing protein 14
MERETPGWAWAILAFLGLAAAVGRWPHHDERALARFRALHGTSDPRHMSAREFRRVPGIGRKLALALVAARDGHDGLRPLAYEDVPGIGEVRAAALRRWVRAQGIDPDPLGPGLLPRATLGAMQRLWPALGLCLAVSGACAPAEPEVEAASGPASVLPLLAGQLHALARGPEDGPVVLLLHGARYSASTWDELGSLAALARAGWRAVAIDWPGYGGSPRWDGPVDAETLLASVCRELGASQVVLVAPSLSGRFALEFLRASPERVRALVAIAPAGAEEVAPARWERPTLLLWGERDEVVPLAVARELASRSGGARLEVFPGAGHACYRDDPGRFHRLLGEFLASLPAPGR